ncbi:MAG TPA: protein-glutamate O-methyltransferase CheR [Verrucomicrobiae bacterium]|nr:protein-glutamate O-methyltransferase CheR [Verrucomicrobiae bacterium]
MEGVVVHAEKDLISRIDEFVQKRSRMTFRGNRRPLLARRVTERVGKLGLLDAAEYLEFLQRNQQEEELFFDLLTTNETYFFRIREQFSCLADEVLPAFQEQRNREVVRSWGERESGRTSDIMKLRVLCAGCSTGEEPYSVAMTLNETLRFPRAWDIRILAGDLSATCLEYASRGVYTEDRMKGIPPEYVARYFHQSPEGYQVGEELRRMVRFHRLNLAGIIDGEDFPGVETPFAGFDLIFCRNVMIYFSPSAQQDLIDTLYRSLVPGGWLFTGDGEPLHLFRHEFSSPAPDAPFVYRKGGCHAG